MELRERTRAIAATLAQLPPLTSHLTRAAFTQRLRRIVDEGVGEIIISDRSSERRRADAGVPRQPFRQLVSRAVVAVTVPMALCATVATAMLAIVVCGIVVNVAALRTALVIILMAIRIEDQAADNCRRRAGDYCR
jgi:hypothetical protein